MMKRLNVVFLALLLGIAWHYMASAQSGIVLENADGQSTVPLGIEIVLTQSLTTVDERVLLEHANGSEYIPLIQAPLALRTLLEQMNVRFVLEHANGNEIKLLSRPATELNEFLETMSPRFILEHANGNQFVSLGYPKELMGDTAKPTMQSLDIVVESGKIVITWQSNEFTRFVLRYGTSPGNYTETIIDTLYSLQHEVELITLQEGETYYFIIESEDISGNKSVITEQKAEVIQKLFQFLPNLHK